MARGLLCVTREARRTSKRLLPKQRKGTIGLNERERPNRACVALLWFCSPESLLLLTGAARASTFRIINVVLLALA
jgi:hypothetical protein